MARAAPLQSNFNAGELDPRMHGRVDYDRLRSGLAVCMNMIPRVSGSATRRPGTYLCDVVKDSSLQTRLVRFKYSTIQAYVLEFGRNYIRVKKNQGPVYDLALPLTGITQANPAVFTYTGTDPTIGTTLDLSGIVGMTELNGMRVSVVSVNGGANTFTARQVGDSADLDTSALPAYVSGGIARRPFELATPYLETDVFDLKFTQNADTLYIWHPDFEERTLTRSSDTNWTLSEVVHIDGPYLAVNQSTTTLTPSAFAPGAGVTVTASSPIGINGGQGFLGTDVGRLIRMKQGSTWGYCLITAVTLPTAVTVTIINTLTSTAAKAEWALGLYSHTTGYPSCGTFYGDRLYRAGCPAEPDRIDGSYVSDYTDMSSTQPDGTVTDSHAVSRRLNEDDVQAVIWMRGTGNGLIIGTLEGEWLVSPSTNTEAITPTNIDAKMSTPYGSANIQPVKAGTALVFVEHGGRRVREAQYQYYDNLLQAPDMTVLAEHITKGDYDPAFPAEGESTTVSSGVKELAYQRKTIPVVWGVRNDGVLIGNTFSKDEKVTGWHRHVLGGWSTQSKSLPAQVESACVIPSSDGSYDELWLVVKRWIGGRLVRSNEFLTRPHEQGDDRRDAVYVDAALTFEGAATTTIEGLHNFRGETVQLMVDGASHPDKVVGADGTLTLDHPGSIVHVGYAYNSDGQTLPYEVGAEDGTALGKIQRPHHVAFMLYETLGLQVGPSFDRLVDIPFRTAADVMGEPPPLFNGIKDDFTWDGDYSKRSVVCWRFSTTQPGEILAILPRMHTQDGG